VAEPALPRSRKALEQARRVLDELPSKAASPTGYRDHVPWALDRLENVWRTINEESRGRRTAEFGTWWAGELSGNRAAINQLRNAEVKRGEQTTRRTMVFKAVNQIRVDEDGRITVVTPSR
jgi:hypothetical protein